MSKTIFRQYIGINNNNDIYSIYQGYHNYKGAKVVCNGFSFITVGNDKLKIPEIENKYQIDFDKLLPSNLDTDEIDENEDIIKYTDSNNRVIKHNYNGGSINIDNKMFGLMCKIAGHKEFYFIVKTFSLVLYRWEDGEYKLKGLLLGVRG